MANEFHQIEDSLKTLAQAITGDNYYAELLYKEMLANPVFNPA